MSLRRSLSCFLTVSSMIFFLVIVIVLVLNVVTVTGVLRRILPDVVHVVLEAWGSTVFGTIVFVRTVDLEAIESIPGC